MKKESVTKVENMEWLDGHYTGEVADGVPHGYGTYTYPNKGVGYDFGIATYEGEFEYGEYHGQGTFKDTVFEYVGEWKEGLKEGQGTETYADDDPPCRTKYVGDWKDDFKHGQGTETWEHGEEYVGQWKNGEMWEGTETDKDGNVTATYSEGVKTKK